MNPADQLFLREEILRYCAGMGATGHKRENLLVMLNDRGFPSLTPAELREQLDYLLGEKLLAAKPSALDASAIRYVLTPAGKEILG